MSLQCKHYIRWMKWQENAQYIVASVQLLSPNQVRFEWSRSKNQKPINDYKNVKFKMTIFEVC